MVAAALLRLPGQKKPASPALRAALNEVQNRLDKTIIFKDISRHPRLSSASILQGYHEIGDTISIWVDSSLPFDAQEAVAAHELAHLAQRLEGFPLAVSTGNASPKEGVLARLNNLVMDDHADRWAASRGFRIDEALQASKLSEVQQGLAALPSPKAVPGGKLDAGLALSYTALKIRLERYGLFGELERLWSERWPAERAAGVILADSLKEIPVSDAASAGLALQTIAAKLGLPIRLRFPRRQGGL